MSVLIINQSIHGVNRKLFITVGHELTDAKLEMCLENHHFSNIIVTTDSGKNHQ